MFKPSDNIVINQISKMTALHAMIKKYVLPNSRMEYNQMNLSFNIYVSI